MPKGRSSTSTAMPSACQAETRLRRAVKIVAAAPVISTTAVNMRASGAMRP